MLDRERFLVIKNLAQNIRKENEKLFNSLEKVDRDDAIRDKNEFLSNLISEMDKQFSAGQKGKEERQIFRANVLIPDDVAFFQNYANDKNIRNLMNTYKVSIEDIMSKITELNIYGKYIDIFNQAPEEPADDNVETSIPDVNESVPAQEETIQKDIEIEPVIEEEIPETIENENSDFVDAMVDLSGKEAESLLDEIEDLSKVAFNITKEQEITETTPLEGVKEELPIEKEKTKPIEIKPKEPVVANKKARKFDDDDDFENISSIVSGFVDEYTKNQNDLKAVNTERNILKKQVNEYEKQMNAMEKEIAELKKSNLNSSNTINELREEKKILNNENSELKEQIEMLKDKIVKSSELIKKIYNSIPR